MNNSWNRVPAELVQKTNKTNCRKSCLYDYHGRVDSPGSPVIVSDYLYATRSAPRMCLILPRVRYIQVPGTSFTSRQRLTKNLNKTPDTLSHLLISSNIQSSRTSLWWREHVKEIIVFFALYCPAGMELATYAILFNYTAIMATQRWISTTRTPCTIR